MIERTPLIVAVTQGHFKNVIILLSRGANPDAQEEQGLSGLMIACMNQRNDMLDALIESGASVSLSDSNEYTALHWAVEFGDAKSVKLLTNAGADPKILMSDGTTLMELAHDRGGSVGQAIRQILKPLIP